MENAGRNAAAAILEIVPNGEICILCGKGNNGGDGYVIARHLELVGHTVRVISVVPIGELSGDAAANQRIAELAEIGIIVAESVEAIEVVVGRASAIVDCLLGTGSQGKPREPIASALRIANQLTSIRIAIDLPSGLDCDTGIPSEPTFRADHTLTFVAPKTGFIAESAAAFLGKIEILSIGVPAKLLRDVKGWSE